LGAGFGTGLESEMAFQGKIAMTAARRNLLTSRTSRAPAMKTLLIVTALLEAVTGVALMVSPAPPVSLLVGAALVPFDVGN